MARQIGQSIIRGEIDNRRQGVIAGRLWLVGRAEPVCLRLAGNCCRDIAGCRLTFRKTSSPSMGNDALDSLQEGDAGDMTASRRMRVFDVPAEEALRLQREGHRAPQHLVNGLYLEWFSRTDGHVVVDASDFIVTVSEPVWTPEPDEEIEPVRGGFFDDDDEDGEALDEFEWERMFRKSDKMSDRYAALLDTYADHPDRDTIIAREMGWAGPEDLEDEAPEGESDGHDAELEDDAADEPDLNPLTEGIDWIRTENGEVSHPLTERAARSVTTMWTDCDARGLLGEPGDPDVTDMLFLAQTLAAKLGGALDSLVYDIDRDGGFVVACLKRCLKQFRMVVAAMDKVRARQVIDRSRLNAFRAELFGIREDILRLMQRLRRQA